MLPGPAGAMRIRPGWDYTRAMKTFRLPTLLLALGLLTLLSACGNKGDLVRPTPTPVPPAAH
jgi:predicted small lipoprotein YifL